MTRKLNWPTLGKARCCELCGRLFLAVSQSHVVCDPGCSERAIYAKKRIKRREGKWK